MSYLLAISNRYNIRGENSLNSILLPLNCLPKQEEYLVCDLMKHLLVSLEKSVFISMLYLWRSKALTRLTRTFSAPPPPSVGIKNSTVFIASGNL